MEHNPKTPAGAAARLSSPTRMLDGRRIVDYDTYIPYFLAAVNNALSRGASASYLETFGVGIADWRVLSILANEPGASAAHICDIVAMDKAAVSRSLRKLETLGVLKIAVSPNDPRRRALALAASGYDLHDRILNAALEREARLIKGVDPRDLETFLRVMRIMRCNVRDL